MRKILIVEDEPTSAILLKEYLKADNCEIHISETGYEALEAIQQECPDVVLLDLGLPDMNGMDLIPEIQKLSKHCEILIVTGEQSANSAIKAIKRGARDYLVKPIEQDRLRISVENAFDRINMARQLDGLQSEQGSIEIGFGDIVGRSSSMLELYKKIETLGKCDEPVFIYGENGTGKSLCARSIHDNGEHAANDFVKINCLSLSHSSLIDACEKARDGKTQPYTLHLQNIADLSAEDQADLLGMLDSDANFRLISTSSHPLLDDVHAGSFREDLYYRTHILPLDLPPLRQRAKDIGLLVNYFLSKFSAEYGKSFKEFDDLTLQTVHDYHWPGNVRELENLIKSIVTLNADTEIVHSSMLPQNILNLPQDAANQNNDEDTAPTADNLFQGERIVAIRDLEQMAIEHALNVCGGNVQEAALKLKISPATLYRKKPTV